MPFAFWFGIYFGRGESLQPFLITAKQEAISTVCTDEGNSKYCSGCFNHARTVCAFTMKFVEY